MDGRKLEGGESMEQQIKEKIKEYIDMLGDRDIVFLERIYTFVKMHLEKNGRL